MQIKEVTDKSLWEKFVQSEKDCTFLQSWNWGEFNKNTGEKIWRVGAFENGKFFAASLIIRINAKRGKFLFVPQGPIVESGISNPEYENLWSMFFEYLNNLGKKEKVDFLRISPLLDNTEKNLDIFRKHGFKNAPIHMMHPETTWLLPINGTEEDIQKGMRKTHRNLIRRAKKDGVDIIQSNEEKYLKSFYDIHMETVRRHKFVPFSYDYMKSEIISFSRDNQVSIFSAEYKGDIISSAIVVFYGDQAFYHHGASSSRFSKIPASYLSLWEAIKEARKRGKKTFNFYGIVKDNPKHPWSGLSNFKKGFGGYKKELLHCQDLPLKKKYLLAYFVEKARRVKRGY